MDSTPISGNNFRQKLYTNLNDMGGEEPKKRGPLEILTYLFKCGLNKRSDWRESCWTRISTWVQMPQQLVTPHLTERFLFSAPHFLYGTMGELLLYRASCVAVIVDAWVRMTRSIGGWSSFAPPLDVTGATIAHSVNPAGATIMETLSLNDNWYW